ncbi:GGDEF domain-containing protein [Pulveribacter suum]|uniref:diguanylate cyclase n=1 Tax=Pulveribacter suum TaxID=2116657 RepID=A0A2P1NPI6_9BURK|nr:GGDEF domain-containing protein [Pulveribacter suum]AVP58917.1 GGDEF domain-containing protein [Pulveribacter suum]
MALDLPSLLIAAAVNLFALSAALPAIMGRDLSPAARSAQRSVLLQAAAWASVLGAAAAADAGRPQLDHLLSTMSVACSALSLWQLHRALGGWLGPRLGRLLVPVLALLIPLGYTLGFGHYAFRVGWSNLLLAVLALLVAASTLRPARPASSCWRLLLLGCLAVMACFTAARGVLGAFTDLYPSFRTPHPVNLAAALALNLCTVLGVVALLTAWREEAEQRLQALALTDGLTGLLNRRGFDQGCAALHAQARRYGWPLTALMLDLDDFKPINDRHGHEAGDRALQLFAQVLRQQTREGDILGRLGGDEFAVLLAHDDARGVQALITRLDAQLQTQALLGLPELVLHFSAGTATLQPGDGTPGALLARADAALYAAKAARPAAVRRSAPTPLHVPE